MNKTVITIGYFALGAVALLVVCLVLIFKPESFTNVVTFIGTIMGIATTGAVTFSALGKQDAKLAKIDTQTNGTNKALHERTITLTNQLLAVTAKLDPADVPADIADTIARAKATDPTPAPVVSGD